MIIAAYAGTGKTTLAALYPEKVIDLVCMPYKYLFGQDNECNEASKANPDNIIQDDWPSNYVHAIKRALDDDDKIILIPTDLLILSLLKSEKLPYTIVYPQRDAKKIYRERFLKRGNTKEFIDIFIGRWDRFLDCLEKDTYGFHIVLQPNQFLGDVVEV